MKGARYVTAWLAATAVAVGVSYVGIRGVLRGAVFERPRAVPILATTGSPTATSTSIDSPTPTPTKPTAKPSASPKPSRTVRPSPSRTGDVRSYAVRGGRAAFEMRSDSARLVSATPDAGYEVQTWRQPEWIRVDFTRDGHGGSLFVTWNGHPPMIQRHEF